MNISIIIVNYKSKGLALNCIKSIKDADWNTPPPPPLSQGEGGKHGSSQVREVLRYEIIVVDNDSGDHIGEILNWQYPEIVFIQNEINLGMGAGNNVGIRRAQGEYVVVMNPDTIAGRDTFVKLYEYMEANKDAGIVGPQLLNPDKSIQPSCFRWYKLMTPVYRRTFLSRTRCAQKDLARFEMRDYSHNEMREVDWLMGSFLFCRAEVLREAGMFDERYFMYFEDTDLCRSIRKKKFKVVYYPDVKVIHNHSRESAKIKWYKFLFNRAARWHIVSWIKYMRKWKGRDL